MKNKKAKKLQKLVLPKFKNEDEERDFWDNIDLTKYFRPEDAVPVSFPNLQPTSHPISIRIPDFLMVRVKEQANELGVPYQSLMKQYISKGAGYLK